MRPAALRRADRDESAWRRAAPALACAALSWLGGPVARAAELPGVLLSRQLAEAEGLAAGDTITLGADPGGAGARELRVIGIYEPTPDPMRLTAVRHEARLHLPDLIALTADPEVPESSEEVSYVAVALRDPADAARVAADLGAAMPGIGGSPTAGARDASNPFFVIERFHLAIAIVTVLGATAFLLALMVMRADERRETVGILRLLGLRRRRVLQEVFFEGLIIAVVGAVAGVILARLTEGMFNRFFQWRYDTGLVFVRVTWPIAARCIGLAVPLGILAGLVAAWTVLRRDVMELLRR